MAVFENPALKAFVAQIADELILAQVLIRRCASGFELRHIEDRTCAEVSLRGLQPVEARTLAQSTARNAFRPLKSAPNLRAGWRLIAPGDAALAQALDAIYPGAIADWYAARPSSPPVTHYREFTRRQTGMYRITAMLTDAQAAQVIRAGCHPQFCMKRRFWTVEGLAMDADGHKSIIPCLEPCALLLEFARYALRLEQEEKKREEPAPSDPIRLAAALEEALTHPDSAIREADFSVAANPRRLRLALEQLQPALELARFKKEA